MKWWIVNKMNLKSIIDAARRWADEHREWVIIGVALPMSTLATAVDKAKGLITKPSAPDEHELRVGRVMSDVKHYAAARKRGEAWAQKPLRTDRKGAASLNTRVADKSHSQTVRMSDLTAILGVDEGQGVVRLEPFATVGDVAQHLDQMGLQLEATIEMKDATLGGLVMALGMTTHSHVCGLVHDTVTAYEIVTADGELVRATADNEHADLFRALPWSHGTLGFLVALEMRVIPAPSHVRLVYRPFYSLDAYAEEYRRLVTEEEPPHFVETLIFGKDRAVILEGHLATQDEVRAGKLPVNQVSRYYKPLFYKHVEGMLELGEGQSHEELVPMLDYLMRHDRSMCMCLAQILPTANEPCVRSRVSGAAEPSAPAASRARSRSGGRRAISATAAIAVTIAATDDAVLNASVKAISARSANSWPAVPISAAIRLTAPTDSSAAVRASAGRPRSSRSRFERYAVLAMLPSTAMPRAPPSSLVVSLTAEPTPALAWGTALMMLPVAGALVMPMPAPRRT